MKNIAALISSVLMTSSAAFAFEGTKTFMPPNDLYKQDSFMEGGLTEAQFNAVIDKVERIYKPIIAKFGGNMVVERAWSDTTVNAYADQKGKDWIVHMFGGLARRPEVTEDGFAMVLCHELGHHLAGFPYVEDWAANEGQSDMFATGTCAWKVLTPSVELTDEAVGDLPSEMIAKCDKNHAAQGNRAICYRTLSAGKSLGDLLAALKNQTVNFNTPDPKVVTRTVNSHPEAQCRLDSYVASAMCGASKWDDALIPGKNVQIRNSMDAQKEAFDHSCVEGDGARPRCWFATLTANPPAPSQECPLGDQAICDLLCTFDPSQPWCKAN